MLPRLLDIAYGRVRSRDLDQAEAFLLDFGMQRAARTADALYMRGHGDGHHHLHVVERGAPGAVALAFHLDGAEDLARAARLPGASAVEATGEPGGGHRVRLAEPNGLCIELVHGMARTTAAPPAGHAMNTAGQPRNRRPGNSQVAPGLSRVHRIGHGVLFTPDVAGTTQWLQDRLGMLVSDVVLADADAQVRGNFLRMDRGEEPVDHHTLLVAHSPVAGLHHLSFEVLDFDDLMAGHEHLRRRPYTHLWGISRHVQGGQVSDYWVDPDGVMFEHWTDGDRLQAGEPVRHLTQSQSVGPWGPVATPAFRQHVVTPIRPWAIS